jgi:hypothetical protein
VIGAERPHVFGFACCEGCVQTATALIILGSGAGNEGGGGDEPGGPNGALPGPSDHQHSADASDRMQRKNQPSVGFQGVEPGPTRLRYACAHIDRIDLGQVIGNSGPRLDVDLGQMLQVRLRALRETTVNFEGVNATIAADQTGENRGVIAGSRSNLEHGLAFAQAKRIEPPRVSARLADVDPARRVQRHERILIDEGKIVVGSLDVTDPGR